MINVQIWEFENSPNVLIYINNLPFSYWWAPLAQCVRVRPKQSMSFHFEMFQQHLWTVHESHIFSFVNSCSNHTQYITDSSNKQNRNFFLPIPCRASVTVWWHFNLIICVEGVKYVTATEAKLMIRMCRTVPWWNVITHLFTFVRSSEQSRTSKEAIHVATEYDNIIQCSFPLHTSCFYI
jgi:hypothetical protein